MCERFSRTRNTTCSTNSTALSAGVGYACFWHELKMRRTSVPAPQQSWSIERTRRPYQAHRVWLPGVEQWSGVSNERGTWIPTEADKLLTGVRRQLEVRLFVLSSQVNGNLARLRDLLYLGKIRLILAQTLENVDRPYCTDAERSG